MFPSNNIKHKMTAFPKMCNYQALKNDMNLFKWAPLSSFCCHLCTLHKNLLGTIQASAVLGMREGVSMGVMRFCMWESTQPTHWSLCPSQGLKWHVMNDFAEPEIFMHELQLYVSVLLLKPHLLLIERLPKGPSNTSSNKLLVIKAVLFLYSFLPEEYCDYI